MLSMVTSAVYAYVLKSVTIQTLNFALCNALFEVALANQVSLANVGWALLPTKPIRATVGKIAHPTAY